MLILWRQSYSKHLLLDINLLAFFVDLLDKRRDKRAILYELIGAGVLLEVLIDLLEPVVAASKDNDEEGKEAREPLKFTISSRKHY